MKYNQPYGVSDPNAPYINGNPSTGTMGSIPPAASIEFPQREIVNAIQMSGLTPTNANVTQLASSIQSQWMNFGIDAGTVNNLQITLPAIPILRHGLVVRVLVAQNNTGPSVLNCNALGAYPIRRKGNVAILANDMQANSVSTMVFNALLGIWELQGVGGAGGRGELTANKDIYVNWAIGNDANDGTANDAAHALKNIQQGINVAFSYNPSPYTITIHVADSQNYAYWYTPSYPGPPIIVLGNPASPANVFVNGVNQHACQVQGINTVTVNGFKHATNTSGTLGPAGHFIATGYAVLNVMNCESGSCQGACFEGAGGTVNVYSHRFTGPSIGEFFWGQSSGGSVNLVMNAVYTITQGITITFVTAFANNGGMIGISPNTPVFTNPGFVVGTRYEADMNGIIAVNGQGANYFPGSVAGVVLRGGQYG